MLNRFSIFVLLAALGALAPSLRAQESGAVLLSTWGDLKWRSDYNAARKEAHEKNLPILIDFGTTSCFWCRKLDESTFRDPRVVALMNERFVPLKIDAEREAHLTNHLRIESYPTIVLATSDGKILSYVKGYQEADTFHEILQRVTANLNAPDSMQRDLQMAGQKILKGDYPAAIAMLRGILDDPKGRPLYPQAQRQLDIIEQKGMERLAQARDMTDKGLSSEALLFLADTVRNFPGIEASRQANDLLARLKDQAKIDQSTALRGQRAKELLAQARNDYRHRDVVPCLERCSVLMRDFGDLPEGHDAMLLMGELKSNPVLLLQAADSLSERLGEMYLALAESHMQKGQPQRAEFFLQRVILACPGSRNAETAQTRLAQVQSIRPNGGASAAKPN